MRMRHMLKKRELLFALTPWQSNLNSPKEGSKRSSTLFHAHVFATDLALITQSMAINNRWSLLKTISKNIHNQDEKTRLVPKKAEP